MDENPQPRRHRFRFSLRALLVGVALLAVPLAWAGYSYRLRPLEAILRSAQLELEKAQDVQRRQPYAISESEMRLLELVRDRARLDVDRAGAIPVWHRDEIRDLDRRRAAVQLEILEVELRQAELTSAQNHEHSLELRRRITALKSELAEARRQAEPTEK